MEQKQTLSFLLANFLHRSNKNKSVLHREEFLFATGLAINKMHKEKSGKLTWSKFEVYISIFFLTRWNIFSAEKWAVLNRFHGHPQEFPLIGIIVDIPSFIFALTPGDHGKRNLNFCPTTHFERFSNSERQSTSRIAGRSSGRQSRRRGISTQTGLYNIEALNRLDWLGEPCFFRIIKRKCRSCEGTGIIIQN